MESLASLESLHEYLKRGTAALHAETDELYSAIGFATASRYVMFLRAQARAVIPLEAALQPFALTFAAAGLPLAARTQQLAEDLAAMGTALPEADSVNIDSFHAALGVFYVIEGSRLGGRMLAREITRLSPDGKVLSVSFLDAPMASGWWASLMDRIEQVALENRRWPSILRGSEMAFGCFITSASAELRATRTQ